MAQHNRWQVDDKEANFLLYLGSTAEKLYKTMNPPKKLKIWITCGTRNSRPKEQLSVRFQACRMQKSPVREADNRYQDAREPLLSYYFHVLDLCQKINPNMDERMKVNHLLNGLYPTQAEKCLKSWMPSNI